MAEMRSLVTPRSAQLPNNDSSNDIFIDASKRRSTAPSDTVASDQNNQRGIRGRTT